MTVSKRQLRTLALQIGRRPGAREVLHDALLERYPALYTSSIERAERLAKQRKRPHIVLFDPSSAALVEGGAHYPFHSYDERRRHFYIFDGGEQHEIPWSAHRIQRIRRHEPYTNAVLVYVTKAGRGLEKIRRERVMFRLDRRDERRPLEERQRWVFALLLDSPQVDGAVTIFTFQGHTSGPLRESIRMSRPALPNEYERLLRAMKQAGYDNLRIVTRAAHAYTAGRARARPESL